MLKTSDSTVAFQIEGGDPVKPTSGNTGRPVLSNSDGIVTSLLSESDARAFATSACAILTAVLFRCARSTTVASDTCARTLAGARTTVSAAIAIPTRCTHLLEPVFNASSYSEFQIARGFVVVRQCEGLFPLLSRFVFVSELNQNLGQPNVRRKRRRLFGLHGTAEIILKHLGRKSQVTARSGQDRSSIKEGDSRSSILLRSFRPIHNCCLRLCGALPLSVETPQGHPLKCWMMTDLHGFFIFAFCDGIVLSAFGDSSAEFIG